MGLGLSRRRRPLPLSGTGFSLCQRQVTRNPTRRAKNHGHLKSLLISPLKVALATTYKLSASLARGRFLFHS
jgi:hypothetical protein